MIIPENYKMINNKPMPEAHRIQYNKATAKIEELESQNQGEKAEHWRDQRHAIMKMAIIATTIR